MNDPNVAAVELVAEALGPLCDELVLVGGCSVGLLITDHARPPVRQTIDVDLVAQVASIVDYYAQLRPKLAARGFVESADSEHICRWTHGSLIVDVMPSTDVFGHSTNVWYEAVVKEAVEMTLGSGRVIKVVSSPLFVATKLESFHGRGGNDYMHHDMEDIITVVDGRAELVAEVEQSDPLVREFLQSEFDDLLADTLFVDQLAGHFRTDEASQGRVPIVIARLRQLAGI